MTEPRITLKNRRAINHYIEHGEKAAAYRHAYDAENMNDNTIRVKAKELFDKPHIQKEILTIQARHQEQTDITADTVRRALMGIVAKCMKDKVDKYGNLIPVAPAAAVSALAEINRMLGFHTKPGEGRDDDPIEGQIAYTLDPEEHRLARLQMLAEDDC